MGRYLSGSLLTYFACFLVLFFYLFQPSFIKRTHVRKPLNTAVFYDHSQSTQGFKKKILTYCEKINSQQASLDITWINGANQKRDYRNIFKEPAAPHSLSSSWRATILKRERRHLHSILLSDFLFEDGDPFSSSTTLHRIEINPEPKPFFMEILGEDEKIRLNEKNQINYHFHGKGNPDLQQFELETAPLSSLQEKTNTQTFSPIEKRDSFILTPKRMEPHFVRVYAKVQGKKHLDNKIYNVIGNQIHFHLYSFTANYEIQGLKQVLRKYKAFHFKAENFLKPSATPNFNQARPGSILVLLGASQNHVQQALKTGKKVLWFPLGKKRNSRNLKILMPMSKLSSQLDFNPNWMNTEGNETANTEAWDNTISPINSLVFPFSKQAKLYHRSSGDSAWFKDGALTFFGLYPFLNKSTLGKVFYEKVMYEFLLSFSDDSNQTWPFTTERKNYLLGEKVELKDNVKKATINGNKIAQAFFLEGKAPSIEKIKYSMAGNQMEAYFAIRLPRHEHYWTRKQVKTIPIETLIEQLKDAYESQPKEWVEEKKKWIKDPLLFTIIFLLFCLAGFLKYREFTHPSR